MDPQLGLFGDTPETRLPAAVGSAPVPEDLLEIAAGLPERVRLGTSSWTFPGWGGLVYDREASKPVLVRDGLEAYARHPLLGAVGVDRSWYAPVPVDTWAEWAAAVPPSFRFLSKAERVVTSPSDPDARSIRTPNPRFLDPGYAASEVVAPFVEGLGRRAGPLLFQFSPMPASVVGGPDAFAERLHAFLAALPPGPTYAVELRTPELLGARYVEALRDTRTSHAYVVHPAMSPLEEQLRRIRPFEQPALVVRWMLRAGLRYEEARDRYRPFDRLVDEDEGVRSRIAVAALDALVAERDVFVIANNKAEGSAPLTVFRLAERIAAWERSTRAEIDADGPTGHPAVTLRWIVGLLRRHDVAHQFVGGLAAQAWGATRELRDIDLYVPAAALPRLLPDLEPWVVRPLERHTDDPVKPGWDLRFVKLRHHGTTVEIGVADGARYRNRATGAWTDQAVDFKAGVEREVLGMRVPVMPLGALVGYKKALDRDVDREDLGQMEGAALPGVDP